MLETFRKQLKQRWRQYLAASLASYGSLCTGMSMGWTSPVLPELRSANSPLPRAPTLQEENWVGSLLVLGGLLGPLITVPLSRHVGRRHIIIGSNLPLLLGWLLAGVATNLPTLYVARIMWGCATGMQFAMVPLYIGEIAEDTIRGSLSAFFLLFINIGFLLAYAIGPFTSYWGLTATGGILSLFYVPFTWFIPETPFFLVYKGKNEEALKTLQALRGTSKEIVQAELEGLQQMVAREFKEEPKIKDLWATRGNIKALGIGPLITVPLSRHVGRRHIIIGSNLPLLLGWLLAGVATNLPTLYVARIMWGCATGMQFAMVPLYIGEIAEDTIRGSLSAFFLLFINIGFLLAYAIGPFTSYWGLTATGGILSLFYVPFTWFIPETPFFLVYKGKNEEALKTLQALRGTSKEIVQAELEGLQQMVAREFKEEPKIKDLWATRGNIKALGICVFLAMLLQLSGIDVLLFYMEELLEKVGTRISASEGTIIMGVVQVVTSFVTPMVVDRLGRRLLMWTTSLGLTIFLALIGVYALLDTYYKYDVASVAFIPLLCLIVYMILFTLGVGPVPWILVAEMFPVKTKCIASGIASFMCWLAGFVWTRFFRDVEAAYGIYTAFWILAICCGFGFLFSVTMLPETKGKTFDEIQDMLNNSPWFSRHGFKRAHLHASSPSTPTTDRHPLQVI